MTALRTAAVWSPDWPITAAARAGALDDPDVPVAVFVANRVVTCSAAAREVGVRRGLRRREAQRRCPELVVLGHDPDRDARMFEPVVAAVENSCPGVEVVRPGLVAVASRGPARYYGGDAALAQRLAQEVDVPVMVGVADGLLAATLAARAGTIIPVGAAADFLSPQAIEALGRPELADLLRRLGIRTLGAFAALSARDVTDRFGTDGAIAHRLAGGLDVRPLAARRPVLDLTVTTDFDPPVQRVDTAAFAARSLGARFHEQLASHGLGCLRLGITARTTKGAELIRTWRHDGALTAAAIADRVRWQLDSWLTVTGVQDENDGIAALTLSPDQVVPHVGHQLGLWGGSGETDERADAALTKVQGLLGPTAVVTAVLDGGRDPSDSIRLVPWGDPREPARIPPRAPDDPPDATPPWPGRLPAPSPATVFTTPQPAEVTDDAGHVVGVTGRYAVTAPPTWLSLDGVRQPIIGWAGPWPVDERWWDPETARRRARFQLVTGDGAGLLAVVDGGRWWVEARYD